MPRKKANANHKVLATQRSYYIAADYIDSGDRLLVEEGDADISLYSVDLTLAQHWYAVAWRGERLDLSPFGAQ